MELEANRPLDHTHVDKLSHDFEQSCQRFEPSHRLRASASRIVIDQLINSLPSGQQHSIKLTSASHPNSYAVLDLGAFMAANQLKNEFRLDTGQHRRAAVLRMNGLSPEVSAGVFLDHRHRLSDPEQKSTMWAVEVYDQDYLTPNPITSARLQMNEIVYHKAKAYGDNFALFHRTANWNGADTAADSSRRPFEAVPPVGRRALLRYNEHIINLIF
jgi:hypothetical protein